jgi:hypothetical protein
LANLKSSPEASRFKLSFIVKTENFQESFSQMWTDLHGGISNPRVGMLTGDAKTGQIAEEFMKFMEANKHEKVEVLNFFN